MLNALWQGLTSPKSDNHVEASAFDSAQVKLLVEHFPIGKKLRYFPESQRRIFLRTVVIAYCINDEVIYANDSILFGDDGLPRGFQAADGKVVPLAKWDVFRLLLPDTTEMEKQLDYTTRAELGRGGQFGKGNIITLVGDVVDQHVPLVETSVHAHKMMQEGPYADTPTILVTPDFDSLVLADRRKKKRVPCAVRASVHYANETAVFSCKLRDFSEATLCVGPNGAGSKMPSFEPRATVIAEFGVPGGVPGEATNYRIRGKVFRRGDEFCVIETDQLYRDGKFNKIHMMDIVEIKTGLLNVQS